MPHFSWLPTRRHLLVLSAGALSACDHLESVVMSGPPLSDEDKALKRKFRGLTGGQLRVDSLFEVTGLNIFDETGKLFFSSATLMPPRGNSIRGYSARFGVPKTLRVEWRDKIEMVEDPHLKGIPQDAFHGGTVLGNYTVPVAMRIPEDLLTQMRRNKNVGFRLKIRIHPDGPLIGWDLASAVDSIHVGGDFQEAHLVYEGDLRNPTKRWVNGWYIHPKTGQRIETDF